MNDDAEAIFQLAPTIAALAKASGDEITLRSAVSRAYYAVFLRFRDRLGVTATTDVHGEVLRGVRRQHGRFISRYLFQMKELRIAADCQFPPPAASRDWEANWKFAESKGRFLLDRFR